MLQPDEVRQALAKDEQVDVESILDNQPENPQDDGWAALLEGLRANDNPALEPTGQPGRQGGIMKSEVAEDVIAKDVIAEDGGEGSGNFNHEGRPGKVGGSGEGGGSSSKSESKEKPKESQRERSSNRKKKNKISKANNRHSNREPRRTVSPNKPKEVLNAGKEKARRSRQRAGNCPPTVCRPKTILPRTEDWTYKSFKTITKRLPNRWMHRVRHTCRL